MLDAPRGSAIATDAFGADDGAARIGGGCCPTPPAETPELRNAEAMERWSIELEGGKRRVDFLAPEIVCGACLSRIEGALAEMDGVINGRVNLTLRRVAVDYDPERTSAADVAQRMQAMGYSSKPFDAAALADFRSDRNGRELLAALAVAGFASMNVMLLSVSVWSGAEAATRDLMHWVSALIALPAIAFAGRPFYRSAAKALSAGRLNMDVPISIAVILAAGVSLFETVHSGNEIYFDAAVMLLFFLLIGRYLDHRTRGLARSAAAELAALSAVSARVVSCCGQASVRAIDELRVGDIVRVLPGERIPADGAVESGTSDIDRSMLTGESAPERVGPGEAVHAGMMNLSGPLDFRVTATEEGTLLAEIARMIEAAENGKNRYTRLADQAAAIYAPAVHLIAAMALIGWLWVTGDWRLSILAASALLIITCPCALGLAVPAVQATAGGALFRRGILLKDGAALEKLAQIDVVVFDKTGTLTLDRPELTDGPAPDDPDWAVAAALSSASRHPLSKAIAAAAPTAPAPIDEIREIPGDGVEGVFEGRTVRLGRRAWVGASSEVEASSEAGASSAEGDGPTVWLGIGDAAPRAFRFSEQLRPDAAEAVAELRALGVETMVLSGDAEDPVRRVAADVGAGSWRAGVTPAEKLATLDALRAGGRRAFMVGDGINDAPALAAAHASMSPVSASDVSRVASGLIFVGESLSAVPAALRIARASRSRALENFGLAAIYNGIAIPLALFGFVTPLVAALCMSGSSIVVVMNALRVRNAAPEPVAS